MLSKKLLLSVTGSVIAVASTVMLVDFIHRKALKKKSCGYELTTGLLGLAAGITLTALVQARLPDAQEPLQEPGDDRDGSCATADAVADRPQFRSIELDEDASIEDFL